MKTYLLLECCLIWSWRISDLGDLREIFEFVDGKWGNEVMSVFKTACSMS